MTPTTAREILDRRYVGYFEARDQIECISQSRFSFKSALQISDLFSQSLHDQPAPDRTEMPNAQGHRPLYLTSIVCILLAFLSWDTTICTGAQKAPPPKATSDNAPPATNRTQLDLQIQKRIRDAGLGLGQSTQVRDDLKRIVVGFHNFHDSMRGFPAPNGMGQPRSKVNGLSWRVMLLPYLDQADLYKQFHLEEPWDSKHNKTLIPQMPKLFGTDAKGQTRVHVLTGPGMPFQNDQRIGINVPDGSSNTILTIIGGPETAEVWTKPGGLVLDPKQPLKALGTLEDHFLITMMDGTVHKMSKAITGPEFLAFARHNDRQIVNFDRLSDGASIAQNLTPPRAAQIANPTTPQSTATSKIDLALIPNEAFFALVAHPRRIASQPGIQKIRQLIEVESEETISKLAPFGYEGLPQRIAFLRRDMGIALENVEELIYLLNQDLPATLLNEPPQRLSWGLVVRNSSPLDIEAIIRHWTSRPQDVSIEEYQGVAMMIGPPFPVRARLIQQFLPERPRTAPIPAAPPPMAPERRPDSAFRPKRTPTATDNPCADEDLIVQVQLPSGPARPKPVTTRTAIALISATVLIVGEEAFVRTMIAARASSAPDTGLKQQLVALNSPLIGIALDAKPLEKGWKQATKFAPPELAAITPYVLGVQEFNLACDWETKEFLNASLKFKSPDLATGLLTIMNGHLNSFKQQYPTLRQRWAKLPLATVSLTFLDHFVNTPLFTSSTDTISVIIPQLKNLDQLPAVGEFWVDSAKNEVVEYTRRVQLSQLKGSFGDFIKKHGHLPAIDGPGHKKPHPAGLSWRVYLLPFFGEEKLYQKFKLNEPWNSPHNQSLIKEFPWRYGCNAEGKTSMHLVAGPGTPFQNGTGMTLDTIKDGAANTLLIIEGGEDTAEIWTKPTALKFDPANPLKCLGNIKVVRFVTFDGRTIRMDMIDGELFARLVQISDGKPVAIPR